MKRLIESAGQLTLIIGNTHHLSPCSHHFGARTDLLFSTASESVRLSSPSVTVYDNLNLSEELGTGIKHSP